jgi:hypothetical protein
LLIAACILLAGIALAGALRTDTRKEKPELGLFTTLPIYWGEAGDLSDLLADDGQIHWARQALQQDYVLRPLDVLEGERRRGGFTDLRFLLMAQPRALSASENVALDAWVRAGGQLLLFADPMLTEESAFAIGDKRRPHDVVLLSPILAHWGLELQFDENQDAGVKTVRALGMDLPVQLHGRFVLRPGSGGVACLLEGQGLAAKCRVGRGEALIIADAAVLDAHAVDIGARTRLLAGLSAMAFRGN